jgi:hypothetical protein
MIIACGRGLVMRQVAQFSLGNNAHGRFANLLIPKRKRFCILWKYANLLLLKSAARYPEPHLKDAQIKAALYTYCDQNFL